MLRLIGLTSLSHFGFITLGIFALSSQGSSGAILYMVNHGVGTAALFLTAGYVYHRRRTTLISEMGGLEKATPVLAGLFLVAGLATLGLPGLSPFVSEFLVLVSAFDYAWYVGAIAVTAVVLAAVYVLWMYERTMTGPTMPDVEGTKDLGLREIGAVAPLMVALVFFGFFPSPLLDVANPFTEDLLVHVGVEDDAPDVPPGPHSYASETEGEN
jgi:NADH-quinone oxidoreductase subunit M